MFRKLAERTLAKTHWVTSYLPYVNTGFVVFVGNELPTLRGMGELVVFVGNELPTLR